VSWGRRLLPVVLVLALALRFWGIGFGLPFAYARPDETEIAGPAVGFLSGDLRPPFFQWPTLFTYIVALMYAVYGGLAGALTGFASLADFAESRRQNIAPFLLAGRFLSMSMGVVTVWAVYAVGRRVFNEIVGVVAAMFLAVAFLHVRDSHFGVTDVAMTGLVVLAVLAIVRWRDEPGFGRAVVAGAESACASWSR
jgi:4-amino-4-deoxy-L-arabinose transferase-like glycosyltransferase